MAAEDDVRLVLFDPTHQLGVTEMLLPAPARRRLVWRRMIDPHPLLLRLCCVARQLSAYGFSGLRTVPPGADGNQDTVNGKTVSVGGRSELTNFRDPLRHLLTSVIPRIEIMIARADDQFGPRVEAFQVRENDRDLRPRLDSRGDIKMVARDHDEVKIFRDVGYPVVLFESVVQVRYKETFHVR